MSNEAMPLHYAIMRYFLDGREDCAEGVVGALSSAYGEYKLFTVKAVDEALATAKENGILDEARCDLGEEGELRIFYRVSDFGKDMIERYIR